MPSIIHSDPGAKRVAESSQHDPLWPVMTRSSARRENGVGLDRIWDTPVVFLLGSQSRSIHLGPIKHTQKHHVAGSRDLVADPSSFWCSKGSTVKHGFHPHERVFLVTAESGVDPCGIAVPKRAHLSVDKSWSRDARDSLDARDSSTSLVSSWTRSF